jgi:dimethylhistidine N-methyltransferase
LSSKPKKLPSKYFYDTKGDALFIKIMHLPEYYLTRTEFEIFEMQSQQIIDALAIKKDTFFELIELGAGDGLKTKQLLSVLQEKGYLFDYYPIDISKNALNKLKKSLTDTMPNLSVKVQQGDYFEVLERFKNDMHQKVILFLGSNIGNLNDELATEFIYKLGANLKTNDTLILGVDLIKSSSIVLPAYNDKQGITSQFNLNLLTRINRELGASFNVDNFEHQAEYSEKEGIAKSFIKSKINQEVTIANIGKTYSFKKGERIHTEISRKYNDSILKNIIKNTDFRILKKLTDTKNYFADYILKRF